MIVTDEEIPINVEEVKNSGKWKEWKKSMNEEIECINSSGVRDPENVASETGNELFPEIGTESRNFCDSRKRSKFPKMFGITKVSGFLKISRSRMHAVSIFILFNIIIGFKDVRDSENMESKWKDENCTFYIFSDVGLF